MNGCLEWDMWVRECVCFRWEILWHIFKRIEMIQKKGKSDC